METLTFLFIGGWLSLAAWIDIKTRTVPHFIIGSGLILTIILWLQTFPTDWVSRIILALIIFVIGIFLLKKNWFGGGDTKLLMILSLIIPTQSLFSLILAIFIIGGLQAGYYLYKKQNSQPYVVAICLGYWWWLIAKFFL